LSYIIQEGECLNMKKESAATIRGKQYTKNADWFCEFTYEPVDGLGYEEGVHRRDPSSVIKVGKLYYVWYTKSVGEAVGFNTGDPEAKVFPWDQSEVWYATSPDSKTWTEQGLAVGRGPKGSYDDRSVFTPELLKANTCSGNTKILPWRSLSRQRDLGASWMCRFFVLR
jgi:hypothetical protein